MTKYLRVMDGLKSHAGGFEYKLNEINISDKWNPQSDEPSEIGGFNFSDEEHILRWLLRGNTLYDVEIPEDAEALFYENNNPKGVYRTNKIIVKNPREVTEKLAYDLYIKSNLPENVYFECLKFLSFKNFEKLCIKIIEDKVNDDNIVLAIETFKNFLEVKDDNDYGCYKKILKILENLKNNRR